MIIVVLAVVGLCMGSFVNALTWRIHEQHHENSKKKPSKEYLKKLSISTGRSICPHCKHELTANDLVPIFSWLSLGGKCRYCKEPISVQYPLVELGTALLFIASYIWWPTTIKGLEVAIFAAWLILLIGLVALMVYDLRWFLLPNRLIYPLSFVAALMALLSIINANRPVTALLNVFLAVIVGGGVFYILFQLSAGKWIGGGDVRLGWLLGLVAGTAGRSVMFIFLGSVIGTVASLPLLASHRLKRDSVIPFGPLLIVGLIITQLFGTSIMHYYRNHLLN
jgi:prepilin signal peptidase PulO-like enzyme (type II secretory pathway)